MKFMSDFTEAANLFLFRCRRVKILSSMDYAIIAGWEIEEIPLAVVSDSLINVFDNLQQNIEPVNIESIRHFLNEVKKLFYLISKLQSY
jgi:hypothetical protein